MTAVSSPRPTTPPSSASSPRRALVERLARPVLVANLVVQVAIVVTGGLVRLTGSGLGCPTWPQCVPGSYTPVVQQPQGIHKDIEFGNRTLTGVVAIAALLALVVVAALVWRTRRPRRLLAVAALPLLGVVVQAVLGGITVLTHLHPATVAAHFLVSMGLVAASSYLLWRFYEPDGAPHPVVRREITLLGRALTALTVVVLLLGTVVTGSGPHSGDAEAPARLGLDPRAMSWLHSDSVLVWFGVLLAILVALRLTAAPDRTQRAARWVLAVGVLQGVIGYVQYLTGLPAVAVALHMLGASLLVVVVTRLLLTLRGRPPLA